MVVAGAVPVVVVVGVVELVGGVVVVGLAVVLGVVGVVGLAVVLGDVGLGLAALLGVVGIELGRSGLVVVVGAVLAGPLNGAVGASGDAPDVPAGAVVERAGGVAALSAAAG